MVASLRRSGSLVASSSLCLVAALGVLTVAAGCVPEGHDDDPPSASTRGTSGGSSGSAPVGGQGGTTSAPGGAGGWSETGGMSQSMGGSAGAGTAGTAGTTVGNGGAGAGSGGSGSGAGGGAAGTGGTSQGTAGGSAGTGGTDSGGAGAPVCTAQCGGKQCGDDGCNGSCGSCSEGASCNGAGQCEQPVQTDHCPVGPADNLWASYPDPWGENQCVVQWSYNSSIIRAHYAEPGHLLYAQQHHTDGQVEFTSAAFLQNLGIGTIEAMKFCQEAPQNGTCVRQEAPDCSQFTSAQSCTVLFNWSYNNTPVRLRRTGSTIWAENQDPNGSWGFSAGGWMDAAGGFANPHAGSLCFAAEKPAGDPEPCP
jgi:hypothetical protein